MRLLPLVPILEVACVAVLMCSCETTGDPRAGGLFGWSEEKAKVRQQQLQMQAAAATESSAGEQAKTARLQQQKQDEDAETRMLEVRLHALMDENVELEKELSDLRRHRKTLSKNLEAKLHELDSGDNQVDRAAAAATAEERRRQAEKFDARNAKLHQAILLMSQR